MNSKKLILDNRIFINGFILISIKPFYEYLNGEKTNKLLGYSYIVVSPDIDFEKISFKIYGKQILDESSFNKKVVFENIVAYPYYDFRSKTIKISALADNISCES